MGPVNSRDPPVFASPGLLVFKLRPSRLRGKLYQPSHLLSACFMLLLLLLCFETRSCSVLCCPCDLPRMALNDYVAEDGLDLLIVLPLLPKCRDSRCAPPCLQNSLACRASPPKAWVAMPLQLCWVLLMQHFSWGHRSVALLSQFHWTLLWCWGWGAWPYGCGSSGPLRGAVLESRSKDLKLAWCLSGNLALRFQLAESLADGHLPYPWVPFLHMAILKGF